MWVGGKGRRREREEKRGVKRGWGSNLLYFYVIKYNVTTSVNNNSCAWCLTALQNKIANNNFNAFVDGGRE